MYSLSTFEHQLVMYVTSNDKQTFAAAFDGFEDRVQHADHGAVRLVLPLAEAAQAVEVTEQLVGPVDEMDDHA